MARVTIEDCLDSVDNRFALVMLAARRAREIADGEEALVDSDNKEGVVALREIAAGKVDFDQNVNELLAEWEKTRRP